MNQRRKPKDPAKDSDPSDKTLILRPGASEEPTRALDARSTLALRGDEAEQMKKATGAMPVQPKPSEEPTVALHISQVPAASTLKLPVGEPEAPGEPTAAESTQKLRAQDIAWVAGESPEAPEGEGTGMTSVDPTSRMRVSRSELSRIVKTKEASLQPPESRETAHLPLRREDSASASASEAVAPGAADRTLILRPETPTAPVSVPNAQIEPAAAAESTLILRPGEEQGTVPILKPHPGSEAATTQMPLETAPTEDAELKQDSASEEGTVPIQKPDLEPEPAAAQTSPEADAPAADATLVLKIGSEEGTVPLVKPVLEPAPATMVMPQVEVKPIPEPAPATMVMPQVEVKPIPEPAPATMVMPQVEVKPVPEPAPATMVMPQVEVKPVPEPAPATMVMPQVEVKPIPEPAPATMVMPQVEPQIARPRTAGPGGTVSVMRTEAPPKPDSAVPRPKAEALPGGPAGPGGTVQLMRTEPAEKETAKPAPVGGTVPVMRIPAPATQLMPQQEAKDEAVVPTPSPSPLSTRPISPGPAAPEPPAPGTQLVPVEELSRLAEIAPEAAPVVATPIPPAASTSFSTRLMPQQPASPTEAAAAQPALRPLPAPAVAPAPTKSAWKLWVGIAGLAVIVIAGGVLWLRPDLLGMNAGTARRPVFRAGGDGPTRSVPAALKSAKDKADAGDAGSMRYLGTCYAHGLGVPRDVEEAKRWYRKAAEAGSQAAREELANLQRLEK